MVMVGGLGWRGAWKRRSGRMGSKSVSVFARLCEFDRGFRSGSGLEIGGLEGDYNFAGVDAALGEGFGDRAIGVVGFDVDAVLDDAEVEGAVVEAFVTVPADGD